MFDTDPVSPGNVSWDEQKIDATSVTVSGGLIRVEVNAFFGHIYSAWAGHVLAQAWVRTLQDSLGVRDDVLITQQGRPFLLYGTIDTAVPLTRDRHVPVVREVGIDYPRDADVVPRTFDLLGWASATNDHPARIAVTHLDSGVTVLDEPLPQTSDRGHPFEFTKPLALDPGPYRITVSGEAPNPFTEAVTVTVQR